MNRVERIKRSKISTKKKKKVSKISDPHEMDFARDLCAGRYFGDEPRIKPPQFNLNLNLKQTQNIFSSVGNSLRPWHGHLLRQMDFLFQITKLASRSRTQRPSQWVWYSVPIYRLRDPFCLQLFSKKKLKMLSARLGSTFYSVNIILISIIHIHHY